MSRERRVVIFAGLLMSLGAFSIDITLPAIPQIAADLDAPLASAQMTVSAYILALGFGQLAWGVLSDRYGRMPVLAGGLAIYALGALAAFLAPSAGWLIAARMLQGIGGGAATVTSRAMIRDVSSGPALASNMALATAFFAVGPIVAPFLGAGLIIVIGWRAVYLALCIVALLLLVSAVRLGETSATRSEISAAALSRAVRSLFGNRQSRWFLLHGPVAMSTMILILSMLPAVYAQAYGVTGMMFAALFAMHGLGIIIGQALNRRLIASSGPAHALLVGACVIVLASGLMLAASLAGIDGAWLMSLLLVLFATSYLVVMANAGSMVLDPHPRIAGLASAVSASLAQLGAGLGVTLLVALLPPTATAFSAALFALCFATLVPALLWRGEPTVHSGA
jgi:DHA1 family bicyclomycin/chloramphenicol resistance-like MFS transporter